MENLLSQVTLKERNILLKSAKDIMVTVANFSGYQDIGSLEMKTTEEISLNEAVKLFIAC